MIRNLLAVCLLAIPTVAGAVAHHPNDAAVRAVQFVDDREGWAIGDDGVIWHSIDGGLTWERQSSGTNASLRAMHFLTPYTGWVVGRQELPGGGSRGIVLGTTDGGITWTPTAKEAMPGLNCIRFFNQKSGVAAGDGSDAFPTGVFTTIDGGQTWKPVPGKRSPTWLAADFTDADTGALSGPWSQLATLRDGFFGAADVDPINGRSIKALKLQGQFGIAVGQGGLILVSSKSAGLKWGFAVPNLPREVLAACDFNAVAIHGKHLWVAGRPGSFVLHSPDLGQTWEMQKTGQNLALHGLYFLDESRGWATGDYGTLLTTVDGGKSWKVARQGAQRSAVLFVHTSADAVPLETIALLGQEEGYLTTTLRLTSTAAPAVPARAPEDDRPITRKTEPAGAHPKHALEGDKLNAATRHVGGGAGEALWQFPIAGHQVGHTGAQLITHWDKMHGEPARTEMLRQLVLAIRIWRPEVIVTDVAAKAGDTLENHLITLLKEAFEKAADAQTFPEQLTTLKLALWSPRKLYATLDRPDPAGVVIPLNDVLTRLGDSPRDYAQPAAALLSEDATAMESRCYRLLASRMESAVGDDHLLQGISLAFGRQARRDMPPVEEEALKARPTIEQAMQKRRTFEKIIRGDGGALVNRGQVLGELATAVKEMPAEQGARAIEAIAKQYAAVGEWSFARETYLLLVEKYPRHPAALEACRWLIRYSASSEARRRQELGHFAVLTETAVQRADPAKQVFVKGGTEIVQTSHTATLVDAEDMRQWFASSLTMESRLAQFGRVAAYDPGMQLCLMSARRQLGDIDAPKKWLSKYLADTAVPLGGQTATRGADPYRDCAMGELWLINRTLGTNPPKPIAWCPKVDTRPKLDGRLNDECWQGVQPLVLSTTAGELDTALTRDEAGKPISAFTSRAWFACDGEHLYVAVQCTHPAGMRVLPVEKRTRDMNLRAFDRVSIMLDLDRDYQTYFQLHIDQRGCLAEDCWGDTRWNPQWYVAIQSDETQWIAEAAIPLRELTAHAPAAGTAWAMNVTRTVPGKGVQAWSTPADTMPRPEGMGLMQFLQKK